MWCFHVCALLLEDGWQTVGRLAVYSVFDWLVFYSQLQSVGRTDRPDRLMNIVVVLRVVTVKARARKIIYVYFGCFAVFYFKRYGS